MAAQVQLAPITAQQLAEDIHSDISRPLTGAQPSASQLFCCIPLFL